MPQAQRTLTYLLISFAIATISSAAENQWTYPFKSASLEDFYFDFIEETEPGEVFEFVKDGTLIIHGKDNPIGYIQTLDEYENYEVKLDWRWPAEPGKSGIQIHSTSDTAYSIWPEGVEIQIEPDSTGDFWLLNTQLEVTEDQMPKKAADRNRRHRLEVKKQDRLKKEIEKKPGQWNTMHIVAKEDTIKVFLNEELVNEATEVSNTSGYITFQAEESDIEIRNFRIRMLDVD